MTSQRGDRHELQRLSRFYSMEGDTDNHPSALIGSFCHTSSVSQQGKQQPMGNSMEGHCKVEQKDQLMARMFILYFLFQTQVNE